MRRRPLSLVAFLVLAAGCPDTHGSGDVGPVDAGPVDATVPMDVPVAPPDVHFTDPLVVFPDSGLPASCDPMDARIDVCGTPCFGITGAFWDGAGCVEAHCDCAGTACEAYPDRAACEAAHAHCEAALCTATGGAWFSRPQFCGHFECGAPPSVACDEPVPACDCGTYGIFVAGVGCMPGPLCELIAPMDPEPLCASTGGTWMLGICGHATCGRLSGLDCASPGCVCGPYQIFDDERGCIQSPDCDVRLPGEDCTETQRCGEGTVCCANGGASADASCSAPMCDSPEGVCGPPRP